jgi:CHAT domain-containing protein/tetratricopeptide (TPR) repeat protein
VRPRRRLALAFLLPLLAACVPADPDGPAKPIASVAEAEKPISVGNNLVGEPCRATQSFDIIQALGATRVLDLKCGQWTRAGGRVSEVSKANVSIDELKALAAEGAWRADLDQRLLCGEAKQTQILTDVPVIWLACSRRNGGLPHVAFVAATSGKIYYADGLPPSQPALERLIGQLAGLVQAGADTSAASSATELLKEQFAGKLVGNADEAQYDRLMQLGRGFNNEGNYAQAAVYYREAVALQQKLLGPDNPNSAQPMMHLAVTLSNQQKFGEATQLLTRAGELIDKIPDPAVKAMYVYYRSLHEANQKHRDEALKLAEQSAEMFRQMGAQGKRSVAEELAASAQGDALYQIADGGKKKNAGKVNSEIGLLESASVVAGLERHIGGAQKSQDIVNALRASAEKSQERAPEAFATVLQVSALNEFDMGNQAKGELDIKAAVQALDQHLANTLPQARAYVTLGTLLVRQKKYQESLAAFRGAVGIAKAKSLSFPIDLIFPYLDALYEVSKQEKAKAEQYYAEMFEASQLAKSSAAAQFVADAAAQLAQGTGEAATAIREFREKRSDFERIQSQLDAEVSRPLAQRDPTLVAELTEKVKAAEKDKDEAEQRVQVLAPDFNQLRLKTVTTADVTKVMRPGEAIYFVLLGDVTSYAFFIHNGRILAFPVALNRNEARARVETLRDAFVIRASGGADPVFASFDVEASHYLYGKLFGPIEDEVLKLNKLIIAQSGALLSLPFALLVVSPSAPIANEDYTHVDWLIRHPALSYVTSMQSFAILREGRSGNRATKPFIGFGDYIQPSKEIMEAGIPDPQCQRDLEELEYLGPLPGTRPEVLSVAKTMGARPGDILLGEDFTKPRIAQIDLSKYRILHLATHALLPSDLKCRQSPSMLFSLPKGSRNLADIFFDTSDILKLKLNADMVVMSACNTSSQGSSGSGESLSGLAQAFFISGARGLVVSHWLAVDQSTVALMDAMYKGIAGGRLDTAHALQAAQLSLIDNAGKDENPVIFSHPLFWAVFTALGDGVEPSGAAAAPDAVKASPAS